MVLNQNIQSVEICVHLRINGFLFHKTTGVARSGDLEKTV
jgi:hypothetical protein